MVSQSSFLLLNEGLEVNKRKRNNLLKAIFLNGHTRLYIFDTMLSDKYMGKLILCNFCALVHTFYFKVMHQILFKLAKTINQNSLLP